MIDLSEISEDIKDKFTLKFQGAEAKIYFGELGGKPAVLKERFAKKYRHPTLDSKLKNERIKAEGKALVKCLSIGVKCPALYYIDSNSYYLVMEQVENSLTARQCIEDFHKNDGQDSKALLNVASKIGQIIAKIHANNLVHGDLTTSNMLVKADQLDKISSGDNFDLYLIDFGLTYHSSHIEDKAVDLYGLERAFLSTHPVSEDIFTHLLNAYVEHGSSDGHKVMKKLDEVKLRGRKRSMLG